MIDFKYGVSLDAIGDDYKNLIRYWRNDYRVWRWCRQSTLIQPNDHKNWLENGDHKYLYLIKLHVPAPHEYVGVCGLTNLDQRNQRAEFSIYVKGDEQGKGYGKAALKTLISHGFQDLNLNCIWGEAYEHNPSIRLFEKLGFTYEGMRRDFYYREGGFIHAKLYSLLKREWTV